MSDTTSLSWSTRLGFILACVGGAVGLGNIWKFPYMVGVQGGGAFVLIYLVTIALIAIPVAVAELLVGRAGQANAYSSVKTLVPEGRNPSLFTPVGLIGILAAFMLLTFYNVIAGWVMAYVYRSFSGALGDVTGTTSPEVFNALLSSPQELMFWQVAFILLIGLVIARNLNSGLERANMILMPLLLAMLAGIMIYGVFQADMEAAVSFLFTPDFGKITPDVVLSAIGHGFFSVGVGAAMLITYGGYIGDDIQLGKAAILIGITDTIVALMAGLGIYAIVFAQNLDPTSGPGLIFTTLPVAFAGIPGGTLLSIVFFLLVLFAALTSALALTEVPVRWIHETTRLSRAQSTLTVLTLAFLVGLATVFSFNIWADVRVSSSGVFADKSLFDVKDYITSNILMPLGGLLVISFMSWVVPADRARAVFNDHDRLFELWLLLSRFVAPAGIIWVFLANL